MSESKAERGLAFPAVEPTSPEYRVVFDFELDFSNGGGL